MVGGALLYALGLVLLATAGGLLGVVLKWQAMLGGVAFVGHRSAASSAPSAAV